MTPVLFGCVPYINALPFYLPFTLQKIVAPFQMTFAPPKELNALLEQQKLEIALTSSLAYFEGKYSLFSGLGISSKKNILSVNLYTQVPLSALNNSAIALTSQSATSVALLQILCAYHWKISPHFSFFQNHKSYEKHAAFLLIGDEALKNPTFPGFQTIDLGLAWYEWTHLPFVFAVFLFRKESDYDKLTPLHTKLNEALAWSMSHKELLYKQALKQCPLPPSRIHEYYSLIHYRLEDQEIEGLNLFKKMWENLKMNPQVLRKSNV